MCPGCKSLALKVASSARENKAYLLFGGHFSLSLSSCACVYVCVLLDSRCNLGVFSEEYAGVALLNLKIMITITITITHLDMQHRSTRYTACEKYHSYDFNKIRKCFRRVSPANHHNPRDTQKSEIIVTPTPKGLNPRLDPKINPKTLFPVALTSLPPLLILSV